MPSPDHNYDEDYREVRDTFFSDPSVHIITCKLLLDSDSDRWDELANKIRNIAQTEGEVNKIMDIFMKDYLIQLMRTEPEQYLNFTQSVLLEVASRRNATDEAINEIEKQFEPTPEIEDLLLQLEETTDEI